MAYTLRYWNGATFTSHVAPVAPPRPGNGYVNDTVQVIGWVCAFLFPLVGFVIGCLCISQGPKHDGWWMTGVSTLFGLMGLALLVTSAMTPTYY
jgi:hypothetical protein